MVFNRVALWEVSLSASAPYLPWHVKLRHQELCDVLMQHCMLPLCMCPFCSQCPGGCLQLSPVPSPQDPIPLALFLNFCLAPMAEIGIRSDCFQYSVRPLSHCYRFSVASVVLHWIVHYLKGGTCLSILFPYCLVVQCKPLASVCMKELTKVGRLKITELSVSICS